MDMLPPRRAAFAMPAWSRGEIVHSEPARRYICLLARVALSAMIVLLALIVFALLMGLLAAAVWVWRRER